MNEKEIEEIKKDEEEERKEEMEKEEEEYIVELMEERGEIIKVVVAGEKLWWEWGHDAEVIMQIEMECANISCNQPNLADYKHKEYIVYRSGGVFVVVNTIAGEVVAKVKTIEQLAKVLLGVISLTKEINYGYNTFIYIKNNEFSALEKKFLLDFFTGKITEVKHEPIEFKFYYYVEDPDDDEEVELVCEEHSTDEYFLFFPDLNRW